MKKSAFLSDVIFTFFIAWLFTLCVFRYLRLNLTVSLLLGGVCGILSACSAGAFLQNKRKTYLLKKSDEAQREKFLEYLCLLGDEQKTEYFRAALGGEDENGVKRSGKLRLSDEENFYFLKFRFAPVTADEVASVARWKTGKRKILLCNRIEENASALCKKLDMQAYTGERVYEILKEKNALPDRYVNEEKPQEKKRRRFRLWFSKRNSRHFLIGGALLLFTSLLTPFPYYYLVFGSVMLLVAVFIRVFGYNP